MSVLYASQVTLEMSSSVTEREYPDPEGYISTTLAVIEVRAGTRQLTLGSHKILDLVLLRSVSGIYPLEKIQEWLRTLDGESRTKNPTNFFSVCVWASVCFLYSKPQ